MATVAINSGLVAFPTAYTRLWATPDGEAALWRPVPPPGYVALGCVAGAADAPPPLSLVGCVARGSVVEARLAECLLLTEGGNLWRVQNAGGTFEVSPRDQHLPQVRTGLARGAA